MKKNKLKKVFALGLSTVLVSMSCLNVSAMDYKKILNKKNISMAAFGSAIVAGSCLLYNYFKPVSKERPKNDDDLRLEINRGIDVDRKIEIQVRVDKDKREESDGESAVGKGGETDSVDETDKKVEDEVESKLNNSLLAGKTFINFEVTDIGKQGEEENNNMSSVKLRKTEEINDKEKANIVETEEITGLHVIREGKNRKNPVLVFSNGEEMMENDLGQNLRQGEDGTIYLKLKDKCYALGKYMVEKKEQGRGNNNDWLFVCTDRNMWHEKDLDKVCIGTKNMMYGENSWKAFVFATGNLQG